MDASLVRPVAAWDSWHATALAFLQTSLGSALAAIMCFSVCELRQAEIPWIHVTQHVEVQSVETGRSVRELQLMVQGSESKFDRRQVLNVLQDELRASDQGDRIRASQIQALIWQARAFHPDMRVGEDLRLGIDSMRAGRHAEAERRLLAVVQADPRFSEGWYRLAQLHYLQGFSHDSLREVDVAIHLDPMHFGGYALKAMNQVQLGRFGLVPECVEQAKSLLPDHAARFLTPDSERALALTKGQMITDLDRRGLSFTGCACLLDSPTAAWSSTNFPAQLSILGATAQSPVKISEKLFEAGLSQNVVADRR